ncbi:hypothetical protein [Streptomyces radiopugnans]|uniref:DUF4352 domain-containing protein n=1 Tax=Streptomyces radiopugnans TaxID=403935 RepID=A0A1H9HEN9_9ACTN|nr:hypothetical protein [Streptomyces radiopugnans]SEQ60800.1 hypothetical protein SAMN05216481_11119 [Streptomyces radiopugnans]
MIRWQTPRIRRTAVAITASLTLAFTLAGCGGGEDGGGDKTTDKPSAGRTADSQEGGTGGKGRVADDSEVIVSVKGPESIVLDVNSVVRDSGGFVTVNGVLKNTSDEDFVGATRWTGPELELIRAAGGSLAGATLVDKAEKKRYYVLRDTENRPLATMKIGTVKANSEQNVFMQFPAPPESTVEVDLQIPTFQNATLEITGE